MYTTYAWLHVSARIPATSDRSDGQHDAGPLGGGEPATASTEQPPGRPGEERDGDGRREPGPRPGRDRREDHAGERGDEGELAGVRRHRRVRRRRRTRRGE